MRRCMGGALSALVGVVLLALPAAAAANRNLYVTNQSSQDLSVFDIAQSGALGPIVHSPFAVGSNPWGVVLSPDGTHLYVARKSTASVLTYSVAADGSFAAIPGNPVATGQLSTEIVALTPDGRHLYAVNSGSNNVSAFGVNADGSLSAVIGSPFPTRTLPEGAAITPDGRHLYVTNRTSKNISAFDISSDGSLSELVGSPFPIIGDGNSDAPATTVLTPDGRHLYVLNAGGFGSVSGFNIAADGSLTGIGETPVMNNGPAAAALTPDGRHLYVTGTGFALIYAFEIAADGSLGTVSGSPFPADGTNRSAAVVSPHGGHLYVANGGSNNVSAYNIAADGSLRSVTGSPFFEDGSGASLESIAITPNQGPTAAFTSASAADPATETFDAGASTDPDGTVARYDWDFGDGTTLADGGPAPTHTYAADGTNTVSVTVTDNEGCSDDFVFTGQMASCNGSARATASQSVSADATLRGAALSAEPTQKQKRKKIKIELGVGGAEQLTAVVTGTVRAGKKSYSLATVTQPVAANQTATLVLKPTKRSATRKLAKALKRGKKVVATLSAGFTDDFGHSATQTALVTLK